MGSAVNMGSKNINIPVRSLDLLTFKPGSAEPAAGDHTHLFAMGGGESRRMQNFSNVLALNCFGSLR